jgi:carbon-monoxide dehydrogenase medium subunit
VGVALTLRARNGTCEDVQVGLNSVASTIVHAKKPKRSCAVSRSQMPLSEMGEVAATECDPTDDNRGSAEYKREMVKVLVRRAATEAWNRTS